MDKLLSQDNSGKEADKETFSVTNSSTAACKTSNDWEFSDILLSGYSWNKWFP